MCKITRIVTQNSVIVVGSTDRNLEKILELMLERDEWENWRFHQMGKI